MRLASRPGPPCRAPAPAASILHCSSSLYDYAKKVYKLVTQPRGGGFYRDEIEIQETHTKHRKLDSQAALPHPTRDRPTDGLRPQAWPLRTSRCDHDPCRLPPRPASLGGLRPAMAAGR